MCRRMIQPMLHIFPLVTVVATSLKKQIAVKRKIGAWTLYSADARTFSKIFTTKYLLVLLD